MSKETPIISSIPKLYKREALDLMMFSWVNAMRFALPATSVEKSIGFFMKRHNLIEDEYPLLAAQRKYFQMQNEARDA